MKYLLKTTLLLVLVGCSPEDVPPPAGPISGGSGSDWLISKSQVLDGGPGKDGIPALEDPEMLGIGSAGLEYLDDEDLVLVYKSGSEVKAYGHPVLDWHEVINDKIGKDYVAITYCPLTGTGMGWGREINSEITTFGVSGLLYETNLIPYDRLTDSNWSQMLNKCVNGSLSGRKPEFFNLIQMNYGALRSIYPKALVTTSNTGHNRSYNQYPYAQYKTNDNFLFPISTKDQRLHPKELVRGVQENDSYIAFTFPLTENRSVVVREFAGEEIVVFADKSTGIMVSFFNTELEGTKLEFTLMNVEGSELILKDQLGNRWDLFGKAKQGPNIGHQLEVPYSYIGYWFSWATFYPGIELHE